MEEIPPKLTYIWGHFPIKSRITHETVHRRARPFGNSFGFPRRREYEGIGAGTENAQVVFQLGKAFVAALAEAKDPLDDMEDVLDLNLSSFVQSRNTQNDERKRFLEPEVAALLRAALRQPPLQRLGLGRLPGKCYTGRPTRQVEACLIPIAVGGSTTAFSRCSVKTGENRNVCPGFGQFRFPDRQTFTPPG